ncbi:hypothetical protein SESBI_42950 [Sesbania bispinosa]|nr:hypothetical protein SESBI_42950 [Sesbania bispinosa]
MKPVLEPGKAKITVPSGISGGSGKADDVSNGEDANQGNLLGRLSSDHDEACVMEDMDIIGKDLCHLSHVNRHKDGSGLHMDIGLNDNLVPSLRMVDEARPNDESHEKSGYKHELDDDSPTLGDTILVAYQQSNGPTNESKSRSGVDHSINDGSDDKGDEVCTSAEQKSQAADPYGDTFIKHGVGEIKEVDSMDLTGSLNLGTDSIAEEALREVPISIVEDLEAMGLYHRGHQDKGGAPKRKRGRPKKKLSPQKVSASTVDLIHLESEPYVVANSVWNLGVELGISGVENEAEMIGRLKDLEERDQLAIGKVRGK